MIPHREPSTTRRDFLARAGLGFGGLALAAMLADDEARAESPTIDPLRPLGAGRRTSRRRPTGSSSSSWRAGRATSTCSTPSRS